jgi:hypothetical protein
MWKASALSVTTGGSSSNAYLATSLLSLRSITLLHCHCRYRRSVLVLSHSFLNTFLLCMSNVILLLLFYSDCTVCLILRGSGTINSEHQSAAVWERGKGTPFYCSLLTCIDR